ALGAQLGGPRSYAGAAYEGVWLGEGREDLGPADIDRALEVFLRADVALWALAAALWTLLAL
ncbi:MAG: cobalamin biosynthesis protein, partial [Methylocystis sp.]